MEQTSTSSWKNKNLKKNKKWIEKRREKAAEREAAEIAMKMEAEQKMEVRKACIEYNIVWGIQCFGLYKGSWVFNDEVKKVELNLSVLRVREAKDAQKQFLCSKLLGREIALDVLGLDKYDDGEFGVILDGGIDSDLKTWYKYLQKEFEIKKCRNSELTWWDVLEPKLRAFRGVFKSLLMMYPDHYHGNWMYGIAFIRGQSVIYNMRSHAKYGCDDDHKELFKILNAILLMEGDLLEEEEGKGDEWEVEGLGDVKHDSDEVSCFMNRLSHYKVGRNLKFYFDIPFFWNNQERTNFMLKVYELIWLQGHHGLIKLVDSHVVSRYAWNWQNHVPVEGPLRYILDYEIGGGLDDAKTRVRKSYGQKSYGQGIDYVRYWRDARQCYKDCGNMSSLEELEEELEEKFDGCWRIHKGLWAFLNAEEKREWVLPLKDKVRQHLNWA